MYIAIDGIDGCGKTTQIDLLKKHLEADGRDVLMTKEPGATKAGLMLRQVLLSTEYDLEPESELLLLSADRLEHQRKVVIPALDAGKTVLSDRFASSTFAYQVAGRGLSGEYFQYLNKKCVEKTPDRLFIIDIDPEISIERAVSRLKADGMQEAEGKFELLGIEFFKRVRQGFLQYCSENPFCTVINGDADAEEIHKAIKEKL